MKFCFVNFTSCSAKGIPAVALGSSSPPRLFAHCGRLERALFEFHKTKNKNNGISQEHIFGMALAHNQQQTAYCCNNSKRNESLSYHNLFEFLICLSLVIVVRIMLTQLPICLSPIDREYRRCHSNDATTKHEGD